MATTNPTAEYTKPIPIPDEASQPFFDAAREHRLAVQHCTNCDTYRWPVWDHCFHCWSTDWEWKDVSGRGTVYTWALMHQLYQEGFKDDLPYVLAVVELDEGPRVRTNVVDVDHGQMAVGMRVEVTFRDINAEVSLPVFRPAGD